MQFISTAKIAFTLPPMQPYTHIFRPQLCMNSTKLVDLLCTFWSCQMVPFNYSLGIHSVWHSTYSWGPKSGDLKIENGRFVGPPARRFTCVPRSKRNCVLDMDGCELSTSYICSVTMISIFHISTILACHLVAVIHGNCQCVLWNIASSNLILCYSIQAVGINLVLNDRHECWLKMGQRSEVKITLKQL